MFVRWQRVLLVPELPDLVLFALAVWVVGDPVASTVPVRAVTQG